MLYSEFMVSLIWTPHFWVLVTSAMHGLQMAQDLLQGPIRRQKFGRVCVGCFLHIPGLTRTYQAGRLETAFPEKWPAGCTVWSSDGNGALCLVVLEQNYKTVTGILSSYRSSVRSLDARGIVQDTWELKRVSWIHDMVDTAQGERIVAVGETESRADRHSIAECAIVGMCLPRLTLIPALTQ